MSPRNVRCLVVLIGMFLLTPPVGPVLASGIQPTPQDEPRVDITGHVAHPGTYPFEELMTVETLIQRAGGLVRQGPPKIVLARIVDGKTLTQVTTLDTPLQPRDTLVVSQPR